MKRKKQPRRKPTEPAGGTPLSGARLVLATELAKHGIAALTPDSEIVRTIVEACQTTERSAAAALRSVARLVQELPAEEQEDLRRVIHFRYEMLYARAAQDGKIETAAKMLDRRARLAGLLAQKEQRPQGEAKADEFEGRSDGDLLFYRDHGYWPEEKPPANVVRLDPLAKLRKQNA